MAQRYAEERAPKEAKKVSVACRIRLLLLDRWDVWRRLTRYRRWQEPHAERLGGTNNASEGAIGWWIEERYRTMRDYKRPESVANVSRLLMWLGNHLNLVFGQTSELRSCACAIPKPESS